MILFVVIEKVLLFVKEKSLNYVRLYSTGGVTGTFLIDTNHFGIVSMIVQK